MRAGGLRNGKYLDTKNKFLKYAILTIRYLLQYNYNVLIRQSFLSLIFIKCISLIDHILTPDASYVFINFIKKQLFLGIKLNQSNPVLYRKNIS